MSGLAALAILAATHLLVDRLTFLTHIPRSRFLSFAGGVSVAYVFLHLFIRLAEGYHQTESYNVFLVALCGLIAFYGVELKVQKLTEGDGEGRSLALVHVGIFALYSVLFGFLLPQEAEEGTADYALFTAAIALHFLTADFGLLQSYPRLFRRYAKFAFTLSLVAGYLLALVVEPPGWLVEGVFAFLAGAVILNVMKEELPENRQSRFGAFVCGAALLVALDLARAL